MEILWNKINLPRPPYRSWEISVAEFIGIPWLPDDYVLPENLSNWLNLTWLNDDIEMLSIKKKQKKSIFDLIEVNNSVESSSAIIDNFVIKNSSKEESKSNVCQSAIISHENDLGKPISRISFGKSSCTSTSNNCIKKGKTNIINASKLLNIKTEKDLVRLLKKESFPGFDKLQWNMFQNHLKKFLNRSIKDNIKDTDVPLSKRVIKQILKWINKS
ncbi:PREDICTED: uncharacterized protein LOC105364795 [Ceratosolen solmsi marchali]|uniref:Uncharacterized protein LOC105364795 n=1 Tax=Ceratosolen solmsi marchali TaxID=326594 RepID=A0AAJ6YN46_9HYME|nr:PREDICTED: uncharacterized protein LOC105364795 [Ceratosolen solmsi marchali]